MEGRSEVKKDVIYDRLLIESSVGFDGKILKVLVMVGPFTFAGSGPDGTHTHRAEWLFHLLAKGNKKLRKRVRRRAEWKLSPVHYF